MLRNHTCPLFIWPVPLDLSLDCPQPSLGTTNGITEMTLVTPYISMAEFATKPSSWPVIPTSPFYSMCPAGTMDTEEV